MGSIIKDRKKIVWKVIELCFSGYGKSKRWAMGVESEYEANTGPKNYIKVIPSTKNPHENCA